MQEQLQILATRSTRRMFNGDINETEHVAVLQIALEICKKVLCEGMDREAATQRLNVLISGA